VLVVPGIGTDAEDPRIARVAARGKGGCVEIVTAIAVKLHRECARHADTTVAGTACCKEFAHSPKIVAA
jgi:hypothetical protein